jgi:hypothetical protein
MTFDWPYYMLRDGQLYEEIAARNSALQRNTQYRRAFRNAPPFATPAQAEAWLEAQDERGNVRG